MLKANFGDMPKTVASRSSEHADGRHVSGENLGGKNWYDLNCTHFQLAIRVSTAGVPLYAELTI